MNDIRLLTEGDLDAALALDEFAFQQKWTPEKRKEIKELMVPEQIWGSFEDGKLAAKVEVLSLRCMMEGTVWSMGGIASVSSWPEYRRGGRVKRLLQQAIGDMKEKGMTVSFLYPFQFAFYRKYGWELVADRKKFELKRNQLPFFPEAGGRMKRVGKDIALLNDIYLPFARKYNGMLVRSENWWKHRVFSKPWEASVWMDDRAVPAGYILYKVEDNRMLIKEMVYHHETARKGLWNFVRNHDSMLDNVECQGPADDALPFLLEDPEIKQETESCVMGRIVDVRRFFERYPFRTDGEGELLRIAVKDDFFEANTALYTIEIEEGQHAVTATETGKDGNEGVLQCDIQTLSAMMFGYQRPTFLADIGRLQGSREAVKVWEKILPSSTPYLIDFF